MDNIEWLSNQPFGIAVLAVSLACVLEFYLLTSLWIGGQTVVIVVAGMTARTIPEVLLLAVAGFAGALAGCFLSRATIKYLPTRLQSFVEITRSRTRLGWGTCLFPFDPVLRTSLGFLGSNEETKLPILAGIGLWCTANCVAGFIAGDWLRQLLGRFGYIVLGTFLLASALWWLIAKRRACPLRTGRATSSTTAP